MHRPKFRKSFRRSPRGKSNYLFTMRRPTTLRCSKNGTATALIEQNPYMQTYNALINLYNFRETS